MAPDNTTWWLTTDLANLSRVKCDCSLYCLSHTHWVITAIDAVALDNTSNVILLAAVTYLERERELTLLSFLKYGGFRQTPVSESSSCSSSPLLPAWYRWHVACGEPRCLFCPWELVQEWACGWQQLIERARGKEKKNSQWERSTPSYALVLERLTSLKPIQRSHFTVGDTGSSPLKKIRERAYLTRFQEENATPPAAITCAEQRKCMRSCALWHTLTEPTPVFENSAYRNIVSALQIEQQRVLSYTKYTQVSIEITEYLSKSKVFNRTHL